MRKTATLLLLALFAVLTPPVEAQTFDVLHNFANQPDGARPSAGLLRDKAGNLYGTTEFGGAGTNGTVFKLDSEGNETVVYSFTAGSLNDGALPIARLIMDKAGNLYGTTPSGGNSGVFETAWGTVFKLDTAGNETVLHSFMNVPDGAFPFAGVVMDRAGNLYGTTLLGGSYNYGTVFKVDASGNETVLHSFRFSDGELPTADLIIDKAGNLYGTTDGGGANGDGTVFKVDASGNETVLYSFTGVPDGQNPLAGLVRDEKGNLYGTTSGGGAYGNGIVFKLDTANNLTVLYSFSFTGSPDGALPYAGLVRDKIGNLYGTTVIGGNLSACPYGCGVVFKLDSTNNLTVLHSFVNSDGAFPLGGLVRDERGDLYGTTAGGGSSGLGTVFKLTTLRAPH